MEPFLLKSNEFFTIKAWVEANPDLVAGFTTKNGGCSVSPFDELNFGFHVGDTQQAVCQNRQTLSELINFPLSNWVGAKQTHDVQIHKVLKEDKGKGANDYDSSITNTDGLYTFEKNILLTLCFADCVPLYFLAPEYGLIGAAHAGWKGTVNKIGTEMINRIKGEGIPLNKLSVVIGPSICENCYIVDDRVITFVQNILEDVEEKPYNLIEDNQYFLDLKKLNKQILIKSGVPEKNISVTGLCTSCDHTLFYSHRRDRGASGRMVSFIGWKEDF